MAGAVLVLSSASSMASELCSLVHSQDAARLQRCLAAGADVNAADYVRPRLSVCEMPFVISWTQFDMQFAP